MIALRMVSCDNDGKSAIGLGFHRCIKNELINMAFNVAELNPFTILAVAIAAVVGALIHFLQVKFSGRAWVSRRYGAQQLAISWSHSGAIGQVLAGLLVV